MACSTNKSPSSESILTLYNPLEHHMVPSYSKRELTPEHFRNQPPLCLPYVLCLMASISVCHVFCIQRHPFLRDALNCFRSPVYEKTTNSIDRPTNLFRKPVYRTGSSKASSISLVHNSGKVMPAARAASGRRDVAVMPGMVFVSNAQQSPLSSKMKSVREVPLHESAL